MKLLERLHGLPTLASMNHLFDAGTPTGATTRRAERPRLRETRGKTSATCWTALRSSVPGPGPWTGLERPLSGISPRDSGRCSQCELWELVVQTLAAGEHGEGPARMPRSCRTRAQPGSVRHASTYSRSRSAYRTPRRLRHLRRAGEAGDDPVAVVAALRDLRLDELRRPRAGADEADVAAQDVQELRQLVQVPRASARAGRPRSGSADRAPAAARARPRRAARRRGGCGTSAARSGARARCAARGTGVGRGRGARTPHPPRSRPRRRARAARAAPAGRRRSPGR